MYSITFFSFLQYSESLAVCQDKLGTLCPTIKDYIINCAFHSTPHKVTSLLLKFQMIILQHLRNYSKTLEFIANLPKFPDPTNDTPDRRLHEHDRTINWSRIIGIIACHSKSSDDSFKIKLESKRYFDHGTQYP